MQPFYLPIELRLKVFEQLDCISLEKCQRVSKASFALTMDSTDDETLLRFKLGDTDEAFSNEILQVHPALTLLFASWPRSRRWRLPRIENENNKLYTITDSVLAEPATFPPSESIGIALHRVGCRISNGTRASNNTIGVTVRDMIVELDRIANGERCRCKERALTWALYGLADLQYFLEKAFCCDQIVTRLSASNFTHSPETDDVALSILIPSSSTNFS